MSTSIQEHKHKVVIRSLTTIDYNNGHNPLNHSTDYNHLFLMTSYRYLEYKETDWVRFGV